MKTLKFRQSLVKPILSGSKDSTWRLFDDKDLSPGDVISFLVWETKKEFAEAELLEVTEKRFSELTEKDREGHERFSSDKKMYEKYSEYYGRKVTKETPVKLIRFKILQI